MNDFVLRRWDLEPYPGDQAPPHVHHRSDEAFCVLSGRIEVLVGDTRRVLEQGDYLTVAAGTIHTFATVGTVGAQVLVVMTREVDELIQALHAASSDEDQADVWARYHSEVVEIAGP